ncbi:MAG: DUF58 domain-containing protein [Planctomycetes bacterium]|nr:DUF58 domain-containing protein [Planctomycetota bacterium]
MLLSPNDLARLAALAAARRASAPGAAGGSRPGAKKGAGSQFEGHRPYSQGDDLRLIDWSAYARTEGLYIREYREEVEGTLAVLLDVSASMAPWGKHLAARRAAAAAVVVALLQGDQAKVAPFAKGRPLEPRGFGSAKDIPEVDRHLEALEAAGPSNGLAAAKSFLSTRRGRFLYVSDLLEEESAGPALVALRERGHSVTVAHVVAAEESRPPAGLLRLRDAESGEVREVLVDEATAASYARALEEFAAGWRSLCAGHGMSYVRLHAGAPLAEWAEGIC